MEFNQSVFKAPSIPKLGKQTVASSVIRGAIKPQIKLKKSTFSFIKPIQSSIDTEKISQPIVNQGIVLENELIETNRILVEIQNQLALDFGYRIAEEKKELAAEKKRISAAKISEKEAKIESGKGILGKTFDKVVAPFKSIFQKLIDFFSIILTGILLNSAFEWLKDKNNRKKLTEFFDFLKEYWQELLIIFAAYKLAKLVGVVFGIGLKLKRLIGWFKNRFGPKIKTPTTTPTPPGLSNAKLGRMNESYGKFIAGKSNIIDRLRLLKRGMIGPGQLFTKGSFEALQGTVKNAPKPSGSSLARGLSRGVAGVALELGGSYAINKALDPLAQKNLRDVISRINEYDSQKKKQTIEKINQNIQKEKNYQSSSLHSLDKFLAMTGGTGLTQSELKLNFDLSVLKGLGETPKFSEGGTVGQGDRSGKDTTPFFIRGGGKGFLDQGEEVVRASEAMRWRPLLKDVNNNGARLWAAFSQGVKDQTFANKDQLELNRNLGDVVKEFKDFVDSEIKKSRQKQKGSVKPPRSPRTPNSRPVQPSLQPRSGASPQTKPKDSVMPDASKPGASGAPGIPGAPRIGDQVGVAPVSPQLPPSPAEKSPIATTAQPTVSSSSSEYKGTKLNIAMNAVSVPGLFDYVRNIREQNKNLDHGSLEQLVVDKTKEYMYNLKNNNLQSVLPNRDVLTPQSNTQEGKTTFINLPPDKSVLPPPPKPSGEVKPTLITEVPSITNLKPHYSTYADLYGVGDHPALF